MRIREKFKKFISFTRREKLFFSEALFLQVSVGLLLKILPFRWIPKLFSNKVHDTGHKVQGSLDLEPEPRCSRVHRWQIWSLEPETSELIKAAIKRSSPYSPWKNKCLVSSLTARRMLSRRKISSQLSLGVAKGTNGKTTAHAWLKAGEFEVVEKSGDYRELYLF